MKPQTKIGAFEANQDDFIYQLWLDIQPYLQPHSRKLPEDSIFFALCDFLDNHDSHWLWTSIKNEGSTETDVYSSLNYFVKELLPHKYILNRPIKNSYGEIIDYEKKKLIKDKYQMMKWKSKEKTPKGILVRYSTKNEIALKGISTQGIMMNVDEFNLFCSETNLDLNTLTIPQLEKLITDYQIDPTHEFWKSYPSMCRFEETYLVEKGITTDKNKTKEPSKYRIGKGFSSNTDKIVNWKEISMDLDVFDF